MATEETNYQAQLYPLFRELKKQRLWYGGPVVDARDLFKREIEYPGTDESGPATPEQLAQQDALLVVTDLLWPLARPSYFLDPEDPRYERQHEAPTITDKSAVQAYMQLLQQLQDNMVAYVGAFQVICAQHIEAVARIFKETPEEA